MGKKLTCEFVQSEFIEIGYTPLFTEYENNDQKLKFRCDNGHNHSITYKDFRTGRRCGVCSGKSNVRHELSVVQAKFIQIGYTPLFNDYKNAHQKLSYLCDVGHKHAITYNHLRQGDRCPSCAEYGFNPLEPGILYYLEFIHQDQSYFKIGVTNRTIKARFSDEPIKPKILWHKLYTIGQDAYNEEQDILKFYRPLYGYSGTSFLKSGNTELFTVDLRTIPTHLKRPKRRRLNETALQSNLQ